MTTKFPPKYRASVHWSAGDAAFIATTEAFPELSGAGPSRGVALTALGTAVRLHQDHVQDVDAGKPATPAAGETYSGKILLRIPKSLHASLASHAEVEGVSLNQYMLHLLAAGHSRA